MAKTISGRTFTMLDKTWYNLRTFFYNHKTFFDILFLCIYSIEQLTLFLLILITPSKAYIFAGIFALLFITTISFEKICTESRYTLLKNTTIIQDNRNEKILRDYRNLEKVNKSLINRKLYISDLPKKTQ